MPPPTHLNYDYPSLDTYIFKHLNSPHPELNSALADASGLGSRHGIPSWTSIASQGKFFMLQCRMLRARHVLEIGTLVGHNAIWCTAANEGVKVTTVEMSEEYHRLAVRNVEAAGVAERVELICGRAQDVLPGLATDVGEGKRERFDVVIVDVEDMGRTMELVELCLRVCRPLACVMVHCAVRKSDLAIEAGEEKVSRTRGSRELIEGIGRHERLDATCFMTMGEQAYDLVVATVRE